MHYTHIPVLGADIVAYVNPVKGGHYIDATYGRGGMSRLLLEHSIGSLTAFDRDPEAVNNASELAKNDTRFTIIHDVFSRLKHYCSQDNIYDGIIFDLGVSSPQLDDGARGFSFMHDGALDMRMSKQGTSASDMIATVSEEELADIFYYYGDERKSRYIARAIVKKREETPFVTTRDLANFMVDIMPNKKSGKHPATKVFQALRIAVNDELNEIKTALEQSDTLLHQGGILAVISFHSIEDRIVKKFFNSCTKRQPISHIQAKLGTAPSQLLTYKLLTPKPVVACDDELKHNNRARSAKLRVMQKLEQPIYYQP